MKNNIRIYLGPNRTLYPNPFLALFPIRVLSRAPTPCPALCLSNCDLCWTPCPSSRVHCPVLFPYCHALAPVPDPDPDYPHGRHSPFVARALQTPPHLLLAQTRECGERARRSIDWFVCFIVYRYSHGNLNLRKTNFRIVFCTSIYEYVVWLTLWIFMFCNCEMSIFCYS